MPKYQFLTHEWVTQARQIREQYQHKDPGTATPARLNVVITDVPFGEGTLSGHLDTTSGRVQIDEGHLDSPEATVTVDYDTARSIIVDGNSPAQAFMAGKIRVEGDITKILALVPSSPDPVALDIGDRIREITA